LQYPQVKSPQIEKPFQRATETALHITMLPVAEVNMSIKIMSHVWEHSQASGTELLLLLAIADHADDQGRAFPSIERLAHKTRTSRTTVKRLLKRLEALGELTVARGQGRNRTSIYRIHLKGSILTPFPEKGPSVTPFPGKKGPFRAKKGSIAVDPQPSYNQDISQKNPEKILRHIGLTPGSRAYEAALNGHQKKTL
jgi:hypothetical protein